MHELHDRIDSKTLGRLRLRMRAMLRPAGAFCPSQQGTGSGAPGSDSKVPTEPQEGGCPAMRQPDEGEIALSLHEQLRGELLGVFKRVATC